MLAAIVAPLVYLSYALLALVLGPISLPVMLGVFGAGFLGASIAGHALR